MRDLPKADLEFLNLQVALWNITSSRGICIWPRTTTCAGLFTFFSLPSPSQVIDFPFSGFLFFKQRNNVIAPWASYVTMNKKNNKVTLRWDCWIVGRVHIIPVMPCSLACLWFEYVLSKTTNLNTELSFPPYSTFINTSWTLEHGLGEY